MKFCAYSKIKQFKDVVRDVRFNATYAGDDAEGNPIYEDQEKPTLTFLGTVKSHGTNAGVCYIPNEGVRAQKRGSFLPETDLTSHMGFTQFVYVTKREFFEEFMAMLWNKHCTSNDEQIMLYGEWSGQGIQKGVAVSELEKNFMVFDCRVYNNATEEYRWVDISNMDFSSQDLISSVLDYPTYSIDIDFNVAEKFQNPLIELTLEVEKECPIGKAHGVSGVGEGIVFTTEWKGRRYQFKSKGEKHSTSRVKRISSVDPEVFQSIMDFVDYAATPNRVNQGIQETGSTKKSDMPILMRWVANDIISEESHEMQANNLEWKQVAREVSNRARQIFFEEIDKI